LKARIEIERFSGKTAISLRQDFDAKIFMMTLCATLAFPLEERIRQESAGDNKHPKKINRTSAISNLRDLWTQIYTRNNWKTAFKAFLIKNIYRPKTIENAIFTYLKRSASILFFVIFCVYSFTFKTHYCYNQDGSRFHGDCTEYLQKVEHSNLHSATFQPQEFECHNVQ